ncbi:MAG: flavodoxin-dependent (E)-4-hydroxy-3-methylbut-2-enyl-diphosphate synthase [Desulfovibrionaceae bacterium]|nr:flavodoxin-dependent (E)-4-hydroxy-3-methylbut-2-enyl-diphosphate synthase [Desulfovibrionaceae bacterium]
MQHGSEKQITLGSYTIGGGAPVLVQSMTNTDTRDVEATVAQIQRLALVGCEAVRVAVPDEAAARALPAIRAATAMPLIADIHFDHRLALAAIQAGFDGIRINPGNIGGERAVAKVVACAKSHKCVIRIGVNSGSVEKDLLARYGGPKPMAMVESALRYVRMLEDLGFESMKVSIKSSSVLDTVESYRLLSRACPYPLHIGVTEAGTMLRGAVKSSVGLGILLAQGIGDTLRVSLTADPTREIAVAYGILRALGLRQRGPEIISCPTCGRTEIDLFSLANAVEEALATTTVPLTVAVMGCVVNGPGEARVADIGVAGGRDKGIIFRKGTVTRVVRGQDALMAAFLEELNALVASREAETPA